ncbi:MAG: FUSC family protein, partial [Caulobacteraceae bacterium]|nr:FUSC family protein [Caulobacter sp.]
ITPVTSHSSHIERALAPLRENLTWNSAILRHAVRATVLTVPALTWALLWWSPYAHWLTITVALTMQPYFATTWQRVLERVGGTLLGGLIAAALAFLPESGMARAVLLVPLCVIGFSVRQVSYGAYIACLTPLIVVLFDVAEPGHSDATIAAMRFGYTVIGGFLALLASLLLWPRWDSRRLRQEVEAALQAHAALAAEALAGPQRPDAAAFLATRRAAGVASNNLEAALSRALQEPRRIRTREVEAALVVDAALRRLGGALIAFPHAAELPAADIAPWRAWTVGALATLSHSGRPASPPPDAPPTSSLARIGRIVTAIEAALCEAVESRDGAARGGDLVERPA